MVFVPVYPPVFVNPTHVILELAMSVPVETVDVAVKLLLFNVPVVALYVKLAAASIATVDPELVLVKIG